MLARPCHAAAGAAAGVAVMHRKRRSDGSTCPLVILAQPFQTSSGTVPDLSNKFQELNLTPEEYMAHLCDHKPIPDGQKLKGLLGRIIVGNEPRDFRWLGNADNATRPTVLALGSDGLQAIAKNSLRWERDRIKFDPLQALLVAGFEPLYIHRRVQHGATFGLAVWSDNEVASTPADWDSLLQYLEQAEMYGEHKPKLMELLRKHIETIKKEPFNELEIKYDRKHGHGAMRAAINNSEHPAYMSLERLLNVDRYGQVSAEDVRAFLIHHGNVAPLFTGTGKTHSSGRDDHVEVDELLVPNLPLHAQSPRIEFVPLASPTQDEVVQYLVDECSKLQRDIDSTPKRVMEISPIEYIEMLSKGKPLPPHVELRGICGRVVYGDHPQHWKFAKIGGFCMGPDGLAAILTRPPMDVLLMCGLNEMHIYNSVKSGCSFGLMVMPVEKVGAKLATWDAFLTYVQEDEKYIDIKDVVKRHRDAMKLSSYHELDIEFVKRYRKPMEKAKGDPDLRMTRQKLARLGESAQACDVRAFFHHDLGLNMEYRGDGYAQLPDGSRSFPEYWFPMKSRKEMYDLGAVCTVIGTPPVDACVEKVTKRYGDLLWRMDQL